MSINSIVEEPTGSNKEDFNFCTTFNQSIFTA